MSPAPPESGSRDLLDFVAVGAERCGTAWLARCLGEHPEIFCPPRGDLHYFSNDRLYDPSLRALRRLLTRAEPDARRGEITPRYLVDRQALQRIQGHCPHARILLVLRNPVDRAYSHYRHYRLDRKQEPEPDFVAALAGPFRDDYVVRSLYGRHVEHVLRIFGPERVHVVLHEDLRRDPAAALRGVYRHLDLGDQRFVPSVLGDRVNASGGTARAARPVWARLNRSLALGRALPRRFVRPAARQILESAAGLVDRMPILQDPSPDLAPAAPVRALVYDRYFRRDVEDLERRLEMDLARWRPDGGAPSSPPSPPSAESTPAHAPG